MNDRFDYVDLEAGSASGPVLRPGDVDMQRDVPVIRRINKAGSIGGGGSASGGSARARASATNTMSKNSMRKNSRNSKLVRDLKNANLVQMRVDRRGDVGLSATFLNMSAGAMFNPTVIDHRAGRHVEEGGDEDAADQGHGPAQKKMVLLNKATGQELCFVHFVQNKQYYTTWPRWLRQAGRAAASGGGGENDDKVKEVNKDKIRALFERLFGRERRGLVSKGVFAGYK